MQGLIRTLKQSEAARKTHLLERADVGTDQNMDTKLRSEENSLAGEGRGRNWSGHGNKAGQREELTTWRGQTSGLQNV